MRARRLVVGAALCAALGLPATAGPQSAGPGGDALARASATWLADGRLLVAGGITSGGVDGRVRIINGAGTAGGLALVSPRSAHTATLMPSGPVLVAGGSDARGPLDSLELIDASAPGVALARLQLTTPVSDHAAALTPDGRVLVSGGLDGTGRVLRKVQALDLSALHAVDLLDLAEPRVDHTATLLTDGRMLITGGTGVTSVLGSAELWDTERGGSAPAPGRLTQARTGHSATLLPSGDVLLAGGLGPDGKPTAALETFSPATNTFTRLGITLAVARTHHSAVLLPTGEVLLLGGVNIAGALLESGEVIDPRAGTVRTVATPLAGFAVTAGPPGLAASLPANGAVGVPTTIRIALRFTAPIAVTSVNGSAAVTLSTARGSLVPIAIVPAESGLLLFITPTQGLATGSRYTVRLEGLRDTLNAALPPASITFTTAGPPGPDPLMVGTGIHIVSDPEEDGSGLPRDARTGKPISEWQWLPPLQAPPGVTALAGQVLRLNGEPLAGVTLEIEGVRTRSDGTGRFLLQRVDPGQQVLVIDGRSANTAGTTWGLFEVGVQIVPKETTPLGYTIWMPKIDTAHAMTIPSPTTSEVVITTPTLPGLELHIPPETVIRDRDGKVVRQISITPVPTARPPYPMPTGVEFPVYFTIQPGSANLETFNPSIPHGAQMIYANPMGAPPGTEVPFWSYEPEGGVGWYHYGTGRVSGDGTKFIPDEHARLYKLTMHTISPPNLALESPPATGPTPAENAVDGDPVDLGTGLFVHTKTDLAIADLVPLTLRRTYRPSDTVSRAFGIGTTHTYSLFLYSENAYQVISLILPEGARVRFNRTSGGTGYIDAVLEHTESPGVFNKAVLKFSTAPGGAGGWEINLTDGTQYVFNYYGKFLWVRDRVGNTLTATRETLYIVGGGTGPYGKITRLTSPKGRTVDLAYDSQDRIVSAIDNIERSVTYSYDSSGRLSRVVDAQGGSWDYTYDASHRMLTLKDARGITYLTNEYYTTGFDTGRVKKQTQADSTTYQFAYTNDGSGKITQTDVTNPRSHVHRVTFNTTGYPLTDTHALGLSEAQALTYTRETGTNRVLTVTDALSRQTAFTYDTYGNVTSITRLNGTGSAVATSFTYYSASTPPYTLLKDIITPLTTTTLAYTSGNLTSITDPRGKVTTLNYNGAGQPLWIKDPLTNQASFGYDGSGNLTGITDPAGNATARTYDAVGRLTTQTDPKGRATTFAWDLLNQLTAIADPLNGVTRFTYDPNGNLLSVTDAKGNATSYAYTSMDRLQTRTDPLSKSEQYQYDNNGNLSQLTDRKSQAHTFSYDGVNRRTGATSPSITTTYTWDGGNRLTQIVDSVGGTITNAYDLLDRLTSQTTPLGTVSYPEYDALDRRKQMTPPGQATVYYTWDAASRLTQIQQGSQVVTFGYDDANRRTSLTLPNGVATAYGYDVASRLTSLIYSNGGGELGRLSYTYDGNSSRRELGGSWARTLLPNALSSATYNAGNRQVTFGGQTLTYDDNGNVTGDGTNTYTWDARDRLTALSASGVSGSFVYDGVGRRQSKTVNSSVMQFIYDGLDIVRDLTDGTPADYLRSLSIDEPLVRNGAEHYVADALGSTFVLTDATAAVATSYTYDAFGTATASGTTSANAVQYTGRENDGTGLYYYRARYYHPGLQRFVSEDPIEFASGDINRYGYVANNPLRYVDPLGLDAFVTIYNSTKQPFGHSGLGVNTTATVGFHPIESAAHADILLHRSVPGRVVSDRMSHLTKIETFRIPTSLEQDACLTNFIGQRTADPGVYILGGRSCGEFVRDALQSCGVKGVDPSGFVAPFGLADRLRLHYKRVP